MAVWGGGGGNAGGGRLNNGVDWVMTAKLTGAIASTSGRLLGYVDSGWRLCHRLVRSEHSLLRRGICRSPYTAIASAHVSFSLLRAPFRDSSGGVASLLVALRHNCLCKMTHREAQQSAAGGQIGPSGEGALRIAQPGMTGMASSRTDSLATWRENLGLLVKGEGEGMRRLRHKLLRRGGRLAQLLA